MRKNSAASSSCLIVRIFQEERYNDTMICSNILQPRFPHNSRNERHILWGSRYVIGYEFPPKHKMMLPKMQSHITPTCRIIVAHYCFTLFCWCYTSEQSLWCLRNPYTFRKLYMFESIFSYTLAMIKYFHSFRWKHHWNITWQLLTHTAFIPKWSNIKL